jgi:hypothetical protein
MQEIKSVIIERNLRAPRFGTGYGRVATKMIEWMYLNTVCK